MLCDCHDAYGNNMVAQVGGESMVGMSQAGVGWQGSHQDDGRDRVEGAAQRVASGQRCGDIGEGKQWRQRQEYGGSHNNPR